MRQSWPLVLLIISCTCGWSQDQDYTLRVKVDEVSVFFHVADFHGVPIDDLKLTDLRLFDNGKKPRQIISFQHYDRLPIRAGFIMDTSGSMGWYQSRNRWIATQYIDQLMKRETDSAFVMQFDWETETLQPFTNDPAQLKAGLAKVGAKMRNRMGGTAIYDTLYRTCRDSFGTLNSDTTANFILLFTDGRDNKSRARIEDDIEICQQSHTAIYVFDTDAKSRSDEGQKVLRELVEKTGGRIFYHGENNSGSSSYEEGNLWADLRLIESDLRSQYRVIYKPADFKRDSSFHRIKLDSPNRGGEFTVRSGYYAAP